MEERETTAKDLPFLNKLNIVHPLSLQPGYGLKISSGLFREKLETWFEITEEDGKKTFTAVKETEAFRPFIKVIELNVAQSYFDENYALYISEKVLREYILIFSRADLVSENEIGLVTANQLLFEVINTYESEIFVWETDAYVYASLSIPDEEVCEISACSNVSIVHCKRKSLTENEQRAATPKDILAEILLFLSDERNSEEEMYKAFHEEKNAHLFATLMFSGTIPSFMALKNNEEYYDETK